MRALRDRKPAAPGCDGYKANAAMGGGMEEFEMNRVRIEVYGSRYVISTPEDESYVRGLAKSLDEQLRSLLENNSGLTLNDALVLCAINFEDAYKKSEASADHMRGQLTDYLEDAAAPASSWRNPSGRSSG